MENSKKLSSKKLIVIILAALVIFAGVVLAVWAIACQGSTIIAAEDSYSYENPAQTKAEADAGFVIDGILNETQYQNCNWLKLENTQGGAGASIAMTSFYGENGMYIVYDVSESAMIYVNPTRPSYLNSCIEMYLASSNASSMNSNEIFEIDMLPTGDLSIRQRTGKDNWVNAASTDDIMARLGATTKGGPVNTEECTGYILELFMPWAFLDKVGIDAAAMRNSFFYINPVHISSFSYEGTNASSDRYWYGFATQLGSDGWNDVSQFFRFGANGVLGTVPVVLRQGEHCTLSGNDTVIPGMMTTVTITPDAGYALDSIVINEEEYIDRVSYNTDGSVTLELRGKKEGLTISASATAVTEGKKSLRGVVQLHKLGGDTLDGVSLSYKGPKGEKPIDIDSKGVFQLTDLEQGYYIVTAIKQGYTPINRGIYLNRDMETLLLLEYEMFQAETGYNWILDDQNSGVLNRFGGSGKVLSVDSYNKFTVSGKFRYDTKLAEMADGDTYLQQRSGIQIKFSNGKYWRVDLMLENGVFKVQYAKHNDGTVFNWKTVHTLTKQEIAQYQSEDGIELSVLRDGRYAWVCLNGKPVAIEVLDSEYQNCTAKVGFEGWVANREIEQMQYNISASVNKNLRDFYVGTSEKWNISGQFDGVLSLPGGGTNFLKFHNTYKDLEFALKNVKETDSSGAKPGRTDILLEFDTNGDGKADKSVSFGIVCTEPANNTCWVQTLGNADNFIPATRIKGLYKLSEKEAEKYLKGYGVELRVIRKGTDAYVFLDGEEIAIFDLTQNNSGIKVDTPAVLSVRHYDAVGDVNLNFEISDQVEDVVIDRVFKDNEKWDLINQYQGVVILPGGGTDTSLQMLKKYQNIDLTLTAKEHFITKGAFGRTDVLFEFDLDNDGTMDKNVSFGIIQLTGGRCVLQTLGWSEKHIPEKRINELYELTYTQAQKYKGEGIDLRVVRYETMVYLYLDDMQVATFDLTQNNSGVTADSKATVFLRHYDAVADEVVIPFKVSDKVEKPEIVAQTKPVFRPNFAWDLSGQHQGVISLPGGGTNAVTFVDTFADFDVVIRDVKENDPTGKKPGRTDILLEFDTNADGKADKSISFGIVCTDRATNSCWVQTLGNADNYIPATRIKGLYKLNTTEAAKYLSGEGVALRLIRKGMGVYVFLDGKAVAIWDLSQNNSGITATTQTTVSIRHYDAEGDVTMNFEISGEVGEIKVDKVFKDNEKWDLSKEQQGIVSLPGGGTDTSLQMLKKHQNIDLTVTAREHDTTGEKFGRTDVLFEFDLNNDGSMDKNVSFGIVQLDGGRCVLQTLGWSEKHIPEKRINELYELTYTQAQKYKGEGIDLRVVRYETMVYLYLDDMQVATFDLTQNSSGVNATTKAAVFLRHYDAVADRVVIPFKVTDQVEKPEVVEQPKPVFKPNYKWDLSNQYEGVVSLPGGGSNAVQFDDKFTDIDLTITAKENKVSSAANGGRTDILFEFENGKNVSFGIVKWSDTSSCIVETLGNSQNHIPASRKNTLYKLSDAETNTYLTDGVQLRVVRVGTDVHVILESQIVAVFDLTQNSSGVTADMPATVSLRHYDAVTDQVVIPFTVSKDITHVTLTDNSVDGVVGAKHEVNFVGAEVVLVSKTTGKTLTGLKLDGVEVPLNTDGTYSFVAAKSEYTVEGIFVSAIFEENYDDTLWDISGQHKGVVTVIGGGGSTAQPLQFAGTYQNIDLTINARDYADSSTASRTDVEFMFDVDGDGVINTAKGDQTVTFGVVYSDGSYRVQTRGGTLLSWKTPYDLNQAEIDQFVITAAEVASGSEDGLDFRMIRYGTGMYLFVENRQVAFCDLTKCANSSGDKASNVKADTEMFVYLRHYDDKRAGNVEIPFAISTQVKPVAVSFDVSGSGTVTANPVNYYVNNSRTSKFSDTHFVGEKITLTVKATKGNELTGFVVDGQEKQLDDNGTYTFTAEKEAYAIKAAFSGKQIFETNYDQSLWDISGQHDGYVTVLGGGGSTAQPLQFAGSYENIDLTVNARDYADSSTAARTDVEFAFDVDGDGVINTSKGDQTVTFGVVYSDKAYRVQTRGGTLLSWKTPYDLNQAEIDQFVITAAEVASGNEDGLDLRMVRYGTVMYLFVENRQVAFCDLTKCANSAGDKASNVKADTEMFVYLRHYDDKRAAGVEIPFSISTEVTPASIAITTNGQGTVTANSVNYYINNSRTSKVSDTHFIGEKVVLTVKPASGRQLTGFKVDGVEMLAQLVKNGDGTATYIFVVTKETYAIEVKFE